jgi:hypothetical protein
MNYVGWIEFFNDENGITDITPRYFFLADIRRAQKEAKKQQLSLFNT